MAPKLGQVLRNRRGNCWRVLGVKPVGSTFEVELAYRHGKRSAFAHAFKLTGSQYRLFCAFENILPSRPAAGVASVGGPHHAA